MNWLDRITTNYCMIEWRGAEAAIAVLAIIMICWIVATAH